jgi:branched-chain amino acid transport system substrate-binding protein
VKRFFSVFLISLFLISCKKSDDTIRLGLAGVRTGPDGQIGTTMFYGSEIAIDEWNAKGGVLGKKIVAITRDDEGKPNQAVTVAQELVANGVAAVIGHFNSGCTIPASEIYQQNNILQITPGSTNPQVTERGYKTLFRICGRDDQQGETAGKFAVNQLQAKKIAILHDKTAYGQGLAEEFKRQIETLGANAVVFDGVSREEMDFRANISAIKANDADLLFFGGMYGQGGPLLVQLRQSGSKIPFLTGDGCFMQEFLNATGQYATSTYLTFFPDFKSMASAQPFLEKYRARYGTEGPYSVYGYEAVNVVLQAIQRAGTTEAKAVAEALRAQPYETCLGKIEFDEKGDPKQSNFIIWQVENGNFVAMPSTTP